MGKIMELLYIFLILFILFSKINCVYLKMDKSIPLCIRKSVDSNEYLTINYLITGDGESEVKMEVFNFIYLL